RPDKVIGVEQPPLWEYPHTDGNRCVIGGYVYRGKGHADALAGQYVFGGFGSGRIWAVADEPGGRPAVTGLVTLAAPATLRTTFGVDNDGEISLCEAMTGGVWKLARAGTPAAPITDDRPIPRLLSQTGVFTDTATLTPAPGLIPYSVNCPLWSDNAAKTR